MSTLSLNHKGLGQLRGAVSIDGRTVQYRGIKYAQIPGRWQDPVLLSKPLCRDDNEFDATKHGPSCPQHPGGFAFDLSLVGDVSLALESGEQSELECLSLIVTAPNTKERLEDLPVFVWIHGGGFSIGSSSWPQYDLSNFVKTSIDCGKPVIGVSINYRLGIFGFLASSELGIPGNYGLKDQSCAFDWIKKNISGFGGDPKRVTAAGESAGAICIHTLMLTKEPLFTQAIVMSGETTLRRPRKLGWQDSHYGAIIQLLGLSHASSLDKKDLLYGASAEEIIKKLPVLHYWSPTTDGMFIPEVNLGVLADSSNPTGKPEWCKNVFIGDTAQDGTVMKARIMDQPDIMSRLHSALEKSLSQAESKRLLDSYSLSGDLGENQQYNALLQLTSDLKFHFPILKVVEGWKGSVNRTCYRYHFHQQNPVNGTYKGVSSHELDVAYLLQNFPTHLLSEHQELGRCMAEVWVDFTYGQVFRGNDRSEVLVIGPHERITFESDIDYDRKYRGRRGEILQSFGWEKVFKLGEMLQGIYEEEPSS